MLGLCGAHRTGKTTLAKRFAERVGIQFITSSSSAIHKELGIPMNADLDIATRLKVQHAILDAAEKAIKDATGPFIADRTPLDMAAYLLADVGRMNVTSAEIGAVLDYVERCYDVTNTYFNRLIVVCPGIPYEVEEGKPPFNIAYQEHHHMLVMGLLGDEQCEVSFDVIGRECLDLEERIETLLEINGEIAKELKELLESVVLH